MSGTGTDRHSAENSSGTSGNKGKGFREALSVILRNQCAMERNEILNDPNGRPMIGH